MGLQKVGHFIATQGKRALNFVYETHPLVKAIAVAAIALAILFPPIAAPFVAITIAALAARITILIIDKVNKNALKSTKYESQRIEKKYPHMKTIAMLTAIILNAINPIAGIIGGAVNGVYMGLVLKNQRKAI